VLAQQYNYWLRTEKRYIQHLRAREAHICNKKRILFTSSGARKGGVKVT